MQQLENVIFLWLLFLFLKGAVLRLVLSHYIIPECLTLAIQEATLTGNSPCNKMNNDLRKGLNFVGGTGTERHELSEIGVFVTLPLYCKVFLLFCLPLHL